MISNHKMQAALDEIREISKTDLALYTETGRQMAATFEPEEDMREAVVSFAAGFLSHLATDVCNKKKVRFLYPLKGGVSLGLFHAYGLANQVFFMAGCAAAALEMGLFAVRIFRR